MAAMNLQRYAPSMPARQCRMGQLKLVRSRCCDAGGGDQEGSAMNTTDRLAGDRRRGRAPAKAWICALALVCALSWLLTSPLDALAMPASYFSSTGIGAMTTTRSQAVAAPLPNGEVLVAGGYNTTTLKSAELFNATTDSFASISGSMVTARNLAVAAPLTSGEVLIAGSGSELFDPASNTFSSAGLGSMIAEHREGVAVRLPSGEVLLAGPTKTSVELFDPGTDTFSSAGLGSMTETRHGAAAAELPNGEVLIAGGGNPHAIDSAELFNPATGTFSSAGLGSMTAAREFPASTALPDGQVLIAGGANGSGEFLSNAELFNPATGTFSSAGLGSMTTKRSEGVAALLPNGQVLIAGGWDGAALSSAEVFESAPQALAASADFGSETVGESAAPQIVTVTNVGAQSLAISGATLGGLDPSDFAITADPCAGRMLAFEQSCALTVQFTPTATGARTASVVLSDNEPSPASIALNGIGEPAVSLVPSPVLALSPPPTPAPAVGHLSESARTWREGGKLPRISRRKKPPIGTTFSFSLNEPANVSLSFTQRVRGREMKHKCVAQTKADRRKRACERTATRGTLSFSGHNGTNKIVFQGRISHSKKLKPGSYALVITATNSGGLRSLPRSLSFTIVK
jgi:Abnormal spindle-like microcephaly-assoc'd, ASPM-SPD-2-Hydin/Galactose oxidase, central domain